MCTICDRPARAFLKGIIGHNGYFLCERCIIKGDRVSKQVVYPEMDCKLRTVETFRSFKNPHHYKLTSLTSLYVTIIPEVNMVKDRLLDSVDEFLTL